MATVGSETPATRGTPSIPTDIPHGSSRGETEADSLMALLDASWCVRMPICTCAVKPPVGRLVTAPSLLPDASYLAHLSASRLASSNFPGCTMWNTHHVEHTWA